MSYQYTYTHPSTYINNGYTETFESPYRPEFHVRIPTTYQVDEWGNLILYNGNPVNEYNALITHQVLDSRGTLHNLPFILYNNLGTVLYDSNQYNVRAAPGPPVASAPAPKKSSALKIVDPESRQQIKPVVPEARPEIKPVVPSGKLNLKILSFNICDNGNLYYMTKGKEEYIKFSKTDNPAFEADRLTELIKVITKVITDEKPNIVCFQEGFLKFRTEIAKQIGMTPLQGHQKGDILLKYIYDKHRSISKGKDAKDISEVEDNIHQVFDSQIYVPGTFVKKTVKHAAIEQYESLGILFGYHDESVKVIRNLSFHYCIYYMTQHLNDINKPESHSFSPLSRTQVLLCEKDGNPFVLINLHSPGIPFDCRRSAYYKVLTDFIQMLKDPVIFGDIPIVIVGDFNTDIRKKAKPAECDGDDVCPKVCVDDTSNVVKMFQNPSFHLVEDGRKTSFKKWIAKNTEQTDWVLKEDHYSTLDFCVVVNAKKIAKEQVTRLPEGFEGIESPIKHETEGGIDRFTPNHKYEKSGFPSDHTLNIYELTDVEVVPPSDVQNGILQLSQRIITLVKIVKYEDNFLNNIYGIIYHTAIPMLAKLGQSGGFFIGPGRKLHKVKLRKSKSKKQKKNKKSTFKKNKATFKKSSGKKQLFKKVVTKQKKNKKNKKSMRK